MTRNSEIEKKLEFCSISGDWGELGIPNLPTDVFNERFLNAGKFPGYSLSFFWVIKGKPRGGWGRGGVKIMKEVSKILSLWATQYFIFKTEMFEQVACFILTHITALKHIGTVP